MNHNTQTIWMGENNTILRIWVEIKVEHGVFLNFSNPQVSIILIHLFMLKRPMLMIFFSIFKSFIASSKFSISKSNDCDLWRSQIGRESLTIETSTFERFSNSKVKVNLLKSWNKSIENLGLKIKFQLKSELIIICFFSCNWLKNKNHKCDIIRCEYNKLTLMNLSNVVVYIRIIYTIWMQIAVFFA